MAKKTPQRCVSSAERKRRVYEVFEMIIESKSTASIVKYCMEKYGVTLDTSYKYVASADKVMSEHLQGKRKDSIKKAIHQREHIIERLMDSDQYAMASQALDSKNKLEGLFTESETTDATVVLKIK